MDFRCRGDLGNEFEIANGRGRNAKANSKVRRKEAFGNSQKNLQISDDFFIKCGIVARKYGTAGAVYWQLGCSSRIQSRFSGPFK